MTDDVSKRLEEIERRIADNYYYGGAQGTDDVRWLLSQLKAERARAALAGPRVLALIKSARQLIAVRDGRPRFEHLGDNIEHTIRMIRYALAAHDAAPAPLTPEDYVRAGLQEAAHIVCGWTVRLNGQVVSTGEEMGRVIMECDPAAIARAAEEAKDG